jgi:hypothetical protein
MRVHLKGVHKVKLASGRTATYFYAWRKGPRLVGEPGSPEFVASYTAAHQSLCEPDRSRFRRIASIPNSLSWTTGGASVSAFATARQQFGRSS